MHMISFQVLFLCLSTASEICVQISVKIVWGLCSESIMIMSSWVHTDMCLVWFTVQACPHCAARVETSQGEVCQACGSKLRPCS